MDGRGRGPWKWPTCFTPTEIGRRPSSYRGRGRSSSLRGGGRASESVKYCVTVGVMYDAGSFFVLFFVLCSFLAVVLVLPAAVVVVAAAAAAICVFICESGLASTSPPLLSCRAS